ncbi:MAG: hypothetical protein UU08_C0001G0007 [Candidatus Uhrbacteria bacterium GW2011_GWE2_40_58]|nr:MAG: hypothetical protein UT94_C0001G0007 [Candidatus Uhrbacteria bacterium GW2011_GWF2_40_263]KKR68233.1 MAG: hypothetical protein UU08_C0001G0007 [Candidatus Uhrbacteria bacterium GW2011_GWE2_40_58]OGL94160.1 MAG: hypothetical protein A2239_03650 [Candidatus Uhrbacteria bacterium RIFOXYA2_FULL_40_9]OGL97494.1 MAG: hypothetical protein A2332_00125 [Candidatus Uhrbacteria bacterium RIFOXYB2_FULL_41_18]
MIVVQSIFGWIILLWLETSFFVSLPWGLWATPLVFTVSLYFYQQHNWRFTLGWVFAYAIFLDFFHLGIVPLETISYSVGIFVAWFTARRWFSHRSFYGVLATMLSAYLSIIASQTIILFIQWFFHPEWVSWMAFYSFSGLRLILMSGLMLFLFPVIQRVQKLLQASFLLSRSW